MKRTTTWQGAWTSKETSKVVSSSWRELWRMLRGLLKNRSQEPSPSFQRSVWISVTHMCILTTRWWPLCLLKEQSPPVNNASTASAASSTRSLRKTAWSITDFTSYSSVNWTSTSRLFRLRDRPMNVNVNSTKQSENITMLSVSLRRTMELIIQCLKISWIRFLHQTSNLNKWTTQVWKTSKPLKLIVPETIKYLEEEETRRKESSQQNPKLKAKRARTVRPWAKTWKILISLMKNSLKWVTQGVWS